MLAQDRSMNVDVEAGDKTLLVSPGFAERGRELHALLSEADRFLEASLGFGADFAIAVLDEESWAGLSPFPYGIPFVSLAQPWVVVVPADVDRSVLMGPFEEMLGAPAARAAIDNIGFHEVGHIYVDEFFAVLRSEDGPKVRWLDEFLASYLAYAFVDAVAEERAALWRVFTRSTLDGPPPRYRGFDDFEAEYYGFLASEEGSPNYNWYQAAFLDLVVRIYSTDGLDFVHTLREALEALDPAEVTSDRVRAVLSGVTPHFGAWSASLGVSDDRD